ncbi:MAG: DNA mismatch repair endonuclease MutL [Phycisphaerales bacterium]
MESTHSQPVEILPSDAPRRIRPLPALVANQIAAGEVVERPASVVKELVENSLDAGATRVSIELEQGGIELIRITDNGSGIDPADLPLAVAPHATSKIADTADLDHIATLGFRGEALASIASVSRMTIRSRTAHSTSGGASQLDIEGASLQPVRPAAGPIGTSITVRNLFFNTPARRKFLRTAQTEKERCSDVIDALALAHPSVGFTFSVDGKLVLDLPPSQGPRARVLGVLGKEVETQMVDVHADRFDDARGVALWGLAGLPSLARGSAKGQHIFVNGRPIKDRTIQHAISEAYRGLIEPGRFPTLVLMLDMSPQGVDVNVHPQKAEVRFRDASMVHSVVLRSLREALAKADLTPTIAALRPAGYNNASWSPAGGGGNGGRDFLGASPSQIGLPLHAPNPTVSAAKFANYFSRFRPGNEQLPLTLAQGDLTQRESSLPSHPRLVPSDPWDLSTPSSHQDHKNPLETQGLSDSSSAQAETALAAFHAARPVIPLPADRLLQVHNSYVITQDEEGVVIIDQHALHERVMFEYLLHRVLAGPLESQRLLMPVAIQASPAQVQLLPTIEPLLTRIGIEATTLSPQSIGVHSFPSFLLERNVELGEFTEELLQKAEAGELTSSSSSSHHPIISSSPSHPRTPAPSHSSSPAPEHAPEHALRDVLDMMACKAAIKAGDKLSESELTELVKLREDVERSSNCPHGRPTSIRLTMRELARLFGRS